MALLRYTRRKNVLFISLFIISTLLVILNYLIVNQIRIDSNFNRFSINKSLVQQKQPNNETIEFEQGKSPSEYATKKSRQIEKRKGPAKRKHKKWRQFYHSKEQIELTKTFKIQPKKCDSKRTGITIFITMRVRGFAKRKLLRRTWVKYARQKGVCVYFLIGLDRLQKNKEKNELEAKEHQDIIQANFIDDYYNLTLKSISVLRWAHTHCKKDHFVMKVDEDVILKIDRFLEKKHLFKKGNFIDIYQTYY